MPRIKQEKASPYITHTHTPSHTLAAAQVPELDGAVVPAGGDDLLVAVKRDALDARRVARQALFCLFVCLFVGWCFVVVF